MRLKKTFGKDDSVVLLLCICLPPIGYWAASRKHWISHAAAVFVSLLYFLALFGYWASGYIGTTNDVLNLNVLWGLVITIAIASQYIESKKFAASTKLLLVLLLGLLILQLAPLESIRCMLQCEQITVRTLKGEKTVLLTGYHLIIFVLSLYVLLGAGVFLSVRENADR